MRVTVVHHRTLRRRALRRCVLRSGGETLVTFGVVLLLLVVHQLWWTNRQAKADAQRQVHALERQWEQWQGARQGAQRQGGPPQQVSGGGLAPGAGGGPSAGPPSSPSSFPSTPSSSSASIPSSSTYAILTIPRLRLRVPVAEGIRKDDVLDRGYAGHYPGTQQPGEAGNFALAGHRNTHGEPFRHLDRLAEGDRVVVETAAAVFTYVVDRVLTRTSPRDSGVLRPVPASLVHPGQGYREPGRYLTLTTCTPAYSSAYRLVVWGKLASAQRR